MLDELEVLTGKGNFKELEEILTFIGAPPHSRSLQGRVPLINRSQRRRGSKTDRCWSTACTAAAGAPSL